MTALRRQLSVAGLVLMVLGLSPSVWGQNPPAPLFPIDPSPLPRLGAGVPLAQQSLMTQTQELVPLGSWVLTPNHDPSPFHRWLSAQLEQRLGRKPSSDELATLTQAIGKSISARKLLLKDIPVLPIEQ